MIDDGNRNFSKLETVILSLCQAVAPEDIEKQLMRQITEDYFLNSKNVKEKKSALYQTAIDDLNEFAKKEFQGSDFSALSVEQGQMLLIKSLGENYIDLGYFEELFRRFFKRSSEKLRILATDITINYYAHSYLSDSEKETVVAFAQTLIPWEEEADVIRFLAEDLLNISYFRSDGKLQGFHLAVHWLDVTAKKRYGKSKFSELSSSQRQEMLTKETGGQLAIKNKYQEFIWNKCKPSLDNVKNLAENLLKYFYDHPIAARYLKKETA